MLNICFTRAGFQMLTSALDPSFTLSSDWYYVKVIVNNADSGKIMRKLPPLKTPSRRPFSRW